MVGEAIILCEAQVPVQVAPPGQPKEELRQACESAARKLGTKSLRSVDLKFLEAHRAKLTDREQECARHLIDEVQFVVFAERALQEEDHRQFGQLMFQSHESSKDRLRDTSPEVDLLIDLARTHPGCLGACSNGKGSANLVDYHQAEKFMEHMSRQYPSRTGVKLQLTVCQIVDGAA
jgi:galactokinase